MEAKLKELLKTTEEVFEKVSFPNGAITASNLSFKCYPKDVKSYEYVWPRDSSYICVAADALGKHEIPRKFFEWCLNYAEDFMDKGVFTFHKFFVHGRATGDWDIPIEIKDVKNRTVVQRIKSQTKVRIYNSNFQPDQTGSLLWAIEEHSKYEDVSQFKDMIKNAANGICKYWKGTTFKIPAHDLWEERTAWPKLNQTLTYSVAMCMRGLEAAEHLCGKKKEWNKCIEEMKIILDKSYLPRVHHFIRENGKKIDSKIDSSMLGLVWPANAFDAKDPRIIQTVEQIERKCVKNGGIYRYPNDVWDGRISNHTILLGGAGAWPVLNFWMSIYQSLAGNEEKALKYFNWVIERTEKYFPEQIKNGKPISIIPLAWSHAMFVIAAQYLNLF
jgi:glucoamylase